MRKLIVSQSVTVDGIYDTQYFTPYQSNERDEYMRETVFAADALLLGRTTYDLLASFWPNQKNPMANKMNNVPKYVVTSTPLKAQWNNATIIKGNVVEEIGKLKGQPGQDILTIGSATLIQSLMRTDLIDKYKLLVHPSIVGSGKRFFNDGMDMRKLKLLESKTLSLGVVLLCFEPAK